MGIATIYLGKTGLSPSLIAKHFPSTVTDFTACSLPPPSAFTFDLLPDDVVLFYFIYLHVSKSLFIYPPPPPDHCLCNSPTYRVALAPFHQKRCYRPYLCFYHTSLLGFRTFSLPPSATETTFTLPQFGQNRLLQYHGLFSHYFYYTSPLGKHNVLYTSHIKILFIVYYILA
jgi:hypothetical protein